MQPKYGFDGQVNACWTQSIKNRSGTSWIFCVSHSWKIYYARGLAPKFYPAARMQVDLHGGHLVSHERTEEVSRALLELIRASEMKTHPNDWTNLPMETSGVR